jgi:hypothetical protein
MPRRPFPSPSPPGNDEFQPIKGVMTMVRYAVLRLRGKRGPVAGKVWWPAENPRADAILAFSLGDAEAGRLAEQAGAVVLVLDGTTSVEDASTVAEWLAAHAGDLTGTSERKP